MGDMARNEELRRELDRVAFEIDDGLLSFASSEAQHEWTSVSARWRPASNAVAMVDDELVLVVQKVRRFGASLRTLKAKSAGRSLRKPR